MIAVLRDKDIILDKLYESLRFGVFLRSERIVPLPFLTTSMNTLLFKWEGGVETHTIFEGGVTPREVLCAILIFSLSLSLSLSLAPLTHTGT